MIPYHPQVQEVADRLISGIDIGELLSEDPPRAKHLIFDLGLSSPEFSASISFSVAWLAHLPPMRLCCVQPWSRICWCSACYSLATLGRPL